jgi:hypothetical protein
MQCRVDTHAELRIILQLSLPSRIPSVSPIVQPIGVDKRSCTLWIDTHNDIFRTRWMTNESHGKPDANWAFPGSASLYAIGADGKSLRQSYAQCCCGTVGSSLVPDHEIKHKKEITKQDIVWTPHKESRLECTMPR